MGEKIRTVGGLGSIAAATLVAAAMLVAPAPARASSAPPNLAWSPTTSVGGYDFGTLDAGAGAAKSVTFTLANAGDRASANIAVSLPGSPAFTVTADSCTGTSLGPRKSCAVTVAYAPTTSGEADTATLTATAVHDSAGLALAGKSGIPSLAFSPASYDFGAVSVGGSATQSFTLTNSGSGTSAPLTMSLSGSSAMSLSSDGCNGAELAPGGTCTVTVAYAPAQSGTDNGTLGAGGATAGLTGTGTAGALTAAIELTECGEEVIGAIDSSHTTIVDGSEDACLVAQVENAPPAGVTYQWVMTTPNMAGYLFNPIQTTASVLLPADSVPDFSTLAEVVALTVTPNGGGAPVTVSGRLSYRNSDMTLACNTQLEAAPPGLTPQASASTIPVAGSLTVTQSYVNNQSHCGAGVPLSGTVTYSADGHALGSSAEPLEPFVIQGGALGVGSHTITVTYAIWNGVAYAPYSVDVPIEVTP